MSFAPFFFFFLIPFFFFLLLLQVQGRCPLSDVCLSEWKAGVLAWIGTLNSESKFISLELLQFILLKPSGEVMLKIVLEKLGVKLQAFLTKLIPLMVA
jgi:hypothetical protein